MSRMSISGSTATGLPRMSGRSLRYSSSLHRLAPTAEVISTRAQNNWKHVYVCRLTVLPNCVTIALATVGPWRKELLNGPNENQRYHH